MADGKGKKRCSVCKEELPKAAFGKHRSTPDGLSYICKACRSAKALKKAGVKNEDEIFSASKIADVQDKEMPMSRAERRQLADDKAREGLPSPKIVDLDKAHPVLDSVKNDALRSRVSTFLGVLLEGGAHKKAMTNGDFSWNQWANVMHKYEGMRDLYRLCRDLGDEYRKILRIDSAHERAVDGVEEPLYSAAGKFLGYKTNYSDRLLELLLKADDPTRYRDMKEKSSDGTVLQVTLGFDRKELKAEQAEITEAEFTTDA